ncbi:MAG: SHOCT domain-containing protein, partial [Nocardioidaceae bacterium]
SNAARKSFLTIATDKQIHTLTNQSSNSVGLKTSNKGHNDVGRVLEVAGNAVLGVVEVEPQPVVATAVIAADPEPAPASQPAAAPTLSDRLRELADLHKESILSDEEFAAAKAKFLGGL